MKKTILLPLLAGLAALATGCDTEPLSVGPSEAVAQQSPAATVQARRPGMRAMNPLGRLLERREELELTADQVTRVEALAAELRTRNEALRGQIDARVGLRPKRSDAQRDSLRARRGAGSGERPKLSEAQREEVRARREALRPQMEELRESQRAAMDEMRDILTDEQEAKLRELRPERP